MQVVKSFQVEAWAIRHPDRKFELDRLLDAGGGQFTLVEALNELHRQLVGNSAALMHEAISEVDDEGGGEEESSPSIIADFHSEHGLLLSDVAVLNGGDSARMLLSSFQWGDRASLSARNQVGEIITQRVEPEDIISRDAAAVIVVPTGSTRAALVLQIMRQRMVSTRHLEALIDRAVNRRSAVGVRADRLYRVRVTPVMMSVDLAEAIQNYGVAEAELHALVPVTDAARRAEDRFRDQQLTGTRKKFGLNVQLKNPNRDMFVDVLRGRGHKRMMRELGTLIGIREAESDPENEFRSIRVRVNVDGKARWFVLAGEGASDEFPFHVMADWGDVGESIEATSRQVWQKLDEEARRALNGAG